MKIMQQTATKILFNMKHLFPVILCILSGMGFISCHNDDDEPIPKGVPQPSLEGTLLDGGWISDVSLYCVEYNKSHGGADYYPKTKTVKDYTDFWLEIVLHMEAPHYLSDDVNEMAAIQKLEREYTEERSSFILEAYKEYKSKNKDAVVLWPELVTAYTDGEVSITCDKTLYGEAPGTNLSEHFRVRSFTPATIPVKKCLPVGVVDSKLLYGYDDEMPTEMSKIFVDEAWLRPGYDFVFTDPPSERYDELTLHLTMPMIKEHVRDYVVAKYKGRELDSKKYTEKVFNAECLIKFDWGE